MVRAWYKVKYHDLSDSDEIKGIIWFWDNPGQSSKQSQNPIYHTTRLCCTSKIGHWESIKQSWSVTCHRIRWWQNSIMPVPEYDIWNWYSSERILFVTKSEFLTNGFNDPMKQDSMKPMTSYGHYWILWLSDSVTYCTLWLN